MSQQIKTIIKFKREVEGINAGKIFGFVTKSNGHWKGCRDTDDCKKKIVFVDPSISKNIIDNMPYNVSLIPMRSGTGFIAMAASPVQFEAKIITKVKKNTFMVFVKFGMKTITYDPSSNQAKYNNINNIAENLRHRIDLLDAAGVAEDFVDAAFMTKSLYNRSKCS